MTLRQLSKLCRAEFSPAVAALGFSELRAPCVFARRAEEVLHVAAVSASRHGPKVRMHVYFWAPDFVAPKIEAADRDIVTCCWSKLEGLGPYSLGAATWWDTSTMETAARSLRAMVAPFVRGANPWLSQVTSRRQLTKYLLPDAPPEVAMSLDSAHVRAWPPSVAGMPVWACGADAGGHAART